MSNVGKATDGMLDTIAAMRRNRDAVKGWLEMYAAGSLISPEVAAHLWEVLNSADTSGGLTPAQVEQRETI